jgi:V-type H+-transporting ATPase subunit H
MRAGTNSHNNRSSKAAVTGGATVQQLYELCFCLWTLTYELDGSAEIRSHFSRDGAVAALVDLVAAAPREKVVRVALSALRNLATCSSDSGGSSVGKRKDIGGTGFLTEMIGCGLYKSIDLLKERQWTDPDIVEDLKVLHGLLHENYKDMTSWDVYVAEVESGHLEWGPIHTEKFFRENAKMMEGPDGDFRLVRTLILLTGCQNEDIAAVACFDVGEFVRHYPNGRSIAKRLGAKNMIMRLIEHENVDLQRQALQCVSKILVQNWAAINK